MKMTVGIVEVEVTEITGNGVPFAPRTAYTITTWHTPDRQRGTRHTVYSTAAAFALQREHVRVLRAIAQHLRDDMLSRL